MVTDSQSAAAVGPKTSRRRQLLATAKRLFLERGFEQTSVSAIVREAGVAQGTFYLYFKSKKDLLPYLRGEILHRYLGAFEESIADRARPVDARLVSGLHRVQAVMAEHVPMIHVVRRATSTEEVEQIWSEGRETLSKPVAALIEAGCAEGTLDVDDPRMAAHLTLALLDDLMFESLVWQRPAGPEQTLAHATRFLLRALGCAPDRITELVPKPT